MRLPLSEPLRRTSQVLTPIRTLGVEATVALACTLMLMPSHPRTLPPTLTKAAIARIDGPYASAHIRLTDDGLAPTGAYIPAAASTSPLSSAASA